MAKERNPDWTRDELLVALDYYLRHPGETHGPEKAHVATLTQTIGKVAKSLGITGTDTLRNTNGVSMKLLNFRAHDPEYKARGLVGLTRGNKLEGEVWREFEGRKEELQKIVEAIIAASTNETSPDLRDDNADFEAPEGRILSRVHQRRERNRTLVQRKKNAVLRSKGELRCEVCDFDFYERYGERGHGFIECHHTVPVSSLSEDSKTSIRDLALVCSNCHRMIHAGRPWWTIAEARAALRPLDSGKSATNLYPQAATKPAAE